MTLSDKIALASRLYTYISSGIQLVSLALMMVALSWKTNTSITTDCCDTMNRWGTTSSCGRLSATTIHYLAARVITSLHGTLLAVRQTSGFDNTKKVHDGRRPLYSKDKHSGLDEVNKVHAARDPLGTKDKQSGMDEAKRRDDRSGFERLLASAFSSCWAKMPNIRVSCASLLHLLRHANAGEITEGGQSAAVMTACAGVLHWLYFLYRE
jgi:hypothetical protein